MRNFKIIENILVYLLIDENSLEESENSCCCIVSDFVVSIVTGRFEEFSLLFSTIGTQENSGSSGHFEMSLDKKVGPVHQMWLLICSFVSPFVAQWGWGLIQMAHSVHGLICLSRSTFEICSVFLYSGYRQKLRSC